MKARIPCGIERTECLYQAVLIVLILIIIPALPLGKSGGGYAMMIASVAGLIGYLLLFGQRLRARGQLAIVALAAGLGALFALVLAWFTRAL